MNPLGEESVLVNFFFSGVPHTASLELVEAEGEWLIQRIDCALPSAAQPIDSFYKWYLAYEGNPLSDRAYQESPYLSEKLTAEVDEIAEGGFRSDPFLCAQDVPGFVQVEALPEAPERFLVKAGELTAFEVEMSRIEGQWQITEIACP